MMTAAIADVFCETDDYRLFVGDLGNEVNDDVLTKAFSKFPSFAMAKVIRNKKKSKTRGYGFVSFLDPNDYANAFREFNGMCVSQSYCVWCRDGW